MLRGTDPADGNALWQRMYRATRWYGRKGAAVSALGAVDTVLWDLRGKALGRSVCSLIESPRGSRHQRGGLPCIRERAALAGRG